jgi:hypothetical protein
MNTRILAALASAADYAEAADAVVKFGGLALFCYRHCRDLFRGYQRRQRCRVWGRVVAAATCAAELRNATSLA